MKPLYRLSERETAAYAFLRGIDYIVEECPFAKGATSIAHKEMLNRLEEASPGAKHNFLFGFLEKARPVFERAEHVDAAGMRVVRTGHHRGRSAPSASSRDQVKRRRAGSCETTHTRRQP